jgi:hypothetical protein
MKLGALDISTVKLGTNQVQAVYQGGNLVWQNGPVATAATGVGQTSFTANWNAYSGATYYLLDVSESSDFSTFVYENEIVLAPNTSYVVIGLNSNTTYYYRVRASDDTPPDSDYEAILSYATTQGYTLPSAGQQVLQNQLVVDLKSAGVWSKLDTFAVFATDAEDSEGSGTSNFALIDWKRLSQYTAVNSPTFTINEGFQGNGASAYITTNFKASSQGVNYLLDNAGRYYWVDNFISGTYLEGIIFTGENATQYANTTSQRINLTNLLNSAVNFASAGFKSINRTSSTNVELFVDNTQYSRTSTSNGLTNFNQDILRSGGFYSNSRLKFYGMGASMVSENTDFYNAINTYINSL